MHTKLIYLFLLTFLFLKVDLYSEINSAEKHFSGYQPSENNQVMDNVLISSIYEKTGNQEIKIIQPQEYNRYGIDLELIFPEKNLVTVKPSIKVKGRSRLLSDVFINGKEIKIKNDSRFFHDLDLPIYGKQTLFITFTTPDYEIINIKRRIIKLYSPPDITTFDDNKKFFIYFFNTPLLYNPDYAKKAGNYLTRADLANFIFLLSKAKTASPATSVFQDVSKDYWAASAIQYVVDNGIMLEFPDGEFKPNRAVSKIEYIIALIRAEKYPLDRSKDKLPYSDVNIDHWTAKFVRTALNHKLIPETVTLRIHDNLTLADFIELVRDFPICKEAVDNLLDFRQGFQSETELEQETIAIVQNILEKKKDKIAKNKTLIIDFPKNGSLVLGKDVEFKGKISPAEQFFINNNRVLPDIDGQFLLKIPSGYGKNLFKISAFNKTEFLNTFSLLQYQDLNNHWVSLTASKLRLLNIFPDQDNFMPKMLISRSNFASKLVKTFNLTSDITLVPYLEDVPDNHPAFNDIIITLEEGILTQDKDGRFNPEKTVSKAEALTAIIRASKIDLVNTASTSNISKFPFSDVSENHWVYKYIQTALNNQLISPEPYFFPGKAINKAELAAILANTPYIKQKLKEMFSL